MIRIEDNVKTVEYAGTLPTNQPFKRGVKVIGLLGLALAGGAGILAAGLEYLSKN